MNFDLYRGGAAHASSASMGALARQPPAQNTESQDKLYGGSSAPQLQAPVNAQAYWKNVYNPLYRDQTQASYENYNRQLSQDWQSQRPLYGPQQQYGTSAPPVGAPVQSTMPLTGQAGFGMNPVPPQQVPQQPFHGFSPNTPGYLGAASPYNNTTWNAR